MTEAPKRIWAWPDKGNPESVTGRWSCNTYSSDLTQSYILATEHERIVADAEAADAIEALQAENARLRKLDVEYGRVETAIIMADPHFDGDSDHANCADRLIASVQRMKAWAAFNADPSTPR